MHRFFVAPDLLQHQPVVLDGEQSHQIRRVLRMRPGEHATLLDNRGWAYEVSLVGFGDLDARFEIVSRRAATGEPRTHITLYQAVLKGERFDWALQKGTEVGISRFVPVVCERSVVNDLRAVEGKRMRWERIIREAAEQSGRARLPVLSPAQPFDSAVQQGSSQPGSASVLRLILWEEEPATTLHEVLAGCNLSAGACIQAMVGPEGGFTSEEVGLAGCLGVRPVTLGSRILRAETAGVVAAAAILYAAGEI